MPIYEYQCKSCGAQEEVVQKLSDPVKEVCDTCGQPSLHKLASMTSFALKGGGWYKDGYSNQASAAASTPAASSPAPAASSPAAT